MIEKTVIDYLSGVVSVPVLAEVPADPPDAFVLVEKTGGGSTNRIRRATLAVQSWAASLLEAAQLNEQVLAAMDGLCALDDVAACGLTGDYNYTDTSTKHHRYQAVFVVHYYQEG